MRSGSTWIMIAGAALAAVGSCTLSTEGTRPGASSSSSTMSGAGGSGGDIGLGGSMPSTSSAGGAGGGAGGPPDCTDPVWGARLSFSPEAHPSGVAADINGNVVMATGFSGTTDLAGMITSNGGTDVLITKYDSTGTVLWARGFGSNGNANEGAESVAVDGSNNVLFTGSTLGSIDFGGGNLPNDGGLSAFVVELRPDGAHRWSSEIPSALGHAIAVDSTGASYVAGHFTAEFEIVPGFPTDFGGGDDAIVVKFDAAGIRKWVRPWGDDQNQRAFGVATGLGDVVYVTGAFESVLDLIPADDSKDLTNPDAGYDAFLVKLDANGALVWSRRLGGAGDQYGRAVAVDSTGAVVVAGDFDGSIDIGGDVHTSTGMSDVFVAKFLPDGNPVWAQHFGDDKGQNARAVTVGPNDQIYLTGNFIGLLDFGAGEIAALGTHEDIFVSVLRPDGTGVFSSAFGESTKDQYGVGIAASGCSILLSGSFDGAFPIGSAQVPDLGGGFESFVAKLNIDALP